jgi:hypothetical protein
VMEERLFRIAGPAITIVIEAEGPVRVYSPDDVFDTARCLVGDEGRRLAVANAMRAITSEPGGHARSAAWGRALARSPGGIHAAIERFISTLHS